MSTYRHNEAPDQEVQVSWLLVAMVEQPQRR